MYVSPEDARSDLFLSVGVYLFGPLLLDIIFQYIPIDGLPVVGPIVAVVVAVATTALVPLLLMRYRGESFRYYGVAPERSASLIAGAVAVLPLVAATVLISFLVADSPLIRVPVLQVGVDVFAVVLRLVQWVGIAFLAAYGTVKARDAFRSDPRTIRELSMEIGRILSIALAVSVVLLVVGGTIAAIPAVLLALGGLGCVAIAVQSVRGPSSATRAVLLTPTVILALRVFNLTLDGRAFFLTLWLTGIVACVGLVIGIFQESRNSALAAIGAGLTVALFTNL